MKKTLYLFLSCLLACCLASCDQDIDFAYKGKDRIQFQHYTLDYNDVRHYSDTISFSCGLEPDSVKVDTLNVVFEFLGRGSDQERTYYVSVVEDSTTAIVDVHYGAFAREQKFAPNTLTDTLRIPIYRENLSSDYTLRESYRLYLKLEPSEDFDLGLEGGLIKDIKFNNYLSEPIWWEGNFRGSLGFYHPEKWKILMEFDKAFANFNTCPYDMNGLGGSYASQLGRYLDYYIVIDEATGKRVTMGGLVDIES